MRVRVFVAAVAAACSALTMVSAPSAGAIRVNVRLPGNNAPNFPPMTEQLLGVCLQTSAQPATCVLI